MGVGLAVSSFPGSNFMCVPGFSIPAFRVLVLRCSGYLYSGVRSFSISRMEHVHNNLAPRAPKERSCEGKTTRKSNQIVQIAMESLYVRMTSQTSGH